MGDPIVAVNGRTVTVTFELPFVVGDACVTPYQAERTTVSRIPDICISLDDNLQKVRVRQGGAWYSASHSQMHGVGQYLPDMDAFLAYWLERGDEHAFADRMQWLEGVFAGNTDAVNALRRRLIQGVENALQSATYVMTTEARASAAKVAELEAKLKKLKELQ
ncbi:hypothetical protein [Acidovorax sp. NB1]|uniref:hypothetical protein n=1 Tax=Acidovorax sp. NB1 TaxID=1943571 RepID=UPI0010E11304|nr:hypothetical protein [Acidovorax sp. NB1]GDY37743.1 hypothetical protein ACINB_36350 [Acidovorax sp. NB1]